MGNLTTEKAGIEEDAAENLDVALGMETEESGGEVVDGE